MSTAMKRTIAQPLSSTNMRRRTWPWLTSSSRSKNGFFSQVCHILTQISTRFHDKKLPEIDSNGRLDQQTWLKNHLQDPYYTSIKRDVAIPFTTFVAKSGGLLGLYLGFSFIGLFEVLYHISVSFWKAFCKCPVQGKIWKLSQYTLCKCCPNFNISSHWYSRASTYFDIPHFPQAV